MLTKTRGWPPERRRAQAERCRLQRPWRFSTGPRTLQGLAKTRFNGIKHGNRRFVWRELRHVLALHRQFLRELEVWMIRREKYLT